MCFFKKLDGGQSPKASRLCQLTSLMFLSLFWISCQLRMGCW